MVVGLLGLSLKHARNRALEEIKLNIVPVIIQPLLTVAIIAQDWLKSHKRAMLEWPAGVRHSIKITSNGSQTSKRITTLSTK